jgi:excisionase family DNA binding protein
MDSLTKSPTNQDRKIASKSLPGLTQTTLAIHKKGMNAVKIKVQESEEYITVPTQALELLTYILSTMAEGRSISVIPSDAEISTQQAADLLHVSRPHLVKLLEQGTIPFKKVGSHRRILVEEVLRYQAAQKEQQLKSLQVLAKQAQDLQLGYE